jgi:hypothetical protein
VAAHAAHDFNNELTFIISSVANSIMSLEPGHPARPHPLDFEEAADGSTRTTSSPLAFSFSRGARMSAAPFESLMAN